MAATRTPQLRSKLASPRSLVSMARQFPHRPPHQPRRPRQSTIPAAAPPATTCNRPFASSSHRGAMTQRDLDYMRASAESHIKGWLEACGVDRWGWVIYRCTYKPELEASWNALKSAIEGKLRKQVAASDAPEIAEKLALVWIEDPELEGASVERLKSEFREWVRSARGPDQAHDPSGPQQHVWFNNMQSFFFQVDEDALESCVSGGGLDLKDGYLTMVRAWQDPLPPEQAVDMFGDEVDAEDVMKVQADMIDTDFYDEMDNEMWYVFYPPPSNPVVSRQ